MTTTEQRHYPQIARRIQAVVIDSVIFMFAFLLCALTLSRIEMHGGIKFAILVAVLFFLEPFLVSRMGGTIGHMARNLRIIDTKTGQNIGILRALVRIFIRFLLGAFSLIFILTTRQRQALHDKATGTTVVLRSTKGLHASEIIRETVVEDSGYTYPSRLWRIFVIAVYNILLLIAVGTMHTFTISISCLASENMQACTNQEQLFILSTSSVWFFVMAAIIVLGWKGRLLGARRTPVQAQAS